MAWAWARRVALGGVVLASACRDSNGAGAPSVVTDAGAIDADTSAVAFAVDPTLACDRSTCPATGPCPTASVCAPPAQSVPIAIAASLSAVTLRLEGAYADASLDVDALTLANGGGAITLRTSSTPATFRLVATSADDPTRSGALAITVGAGFATVHALPSYAGTRPAPTYLATAALGATCAALAGTPPSDDAPWTSGPPKVPILLTVPAGQSFAVDVRVGHYAYGCAEIAPLGAGASQDATIDVNDVPMALAQTNLDATFSFGLDADAGVPDWHSALASAATRIEGGFFGSTSQAGALLDAVRATIASSVDQAQFDSLRASNGWDASAATWLTSHAPSIHDRAVAWLDTATSTSAGPLALHLGAGTTTGTAVVSVSSFGPLSSAAAAIAPPAPFAWTADPGDTVHLEGAIDLTSTPLVAHLGDALAAQAVAQSTDAPSAIAIAIDAPGLATSLVGGGVLYGQCAASCAAGAFRTAIAAAWTAASAPASGAADAIHFTLTASAPATIGDYAQPVGFQGAWLGHVSGAGAPESFDAQGSVTATQSAAAH